MCVEYGGKFCAAILATKICENGGKDVGNKYHKAPQGSGVKMHDPDGGFGAVIIINELYSYPKCD